ncbi:MAG: hypothetical protein CME26_06820 [Gemmatimonadetes bacterium]|nr:hypothetical protein [Gemmatimonadota bacterium]
MPHVSSGSSTTPYKRLPAESMRLLPFSLLALVTTLTIESRADWAWQAGDVALFDPATSSASIQERVLQAAESDLDWVILSSPPGTGSFVGLDEILQEADLNVPRVTPIVASGWSSDNRSGIIYGLDPRSPVPNQLDRLLAVAETQQGVVQLDTADTSASSFLLTASRNGTWSPEVEVGAGWDRLLRAGSRVFIAGSNTDEAPGHRHRTYVKARSNTNEDVVNGLRRGSSFVSQNDDIRIDFEVQGSSFGQTAFFEGEAYVRMQAHARDPITRVSLIADGEVVWVTQPDETVWSERFFLPLHHRTYIRPVLENASGYRTLGNPVFLVPDRSQRSGEVPFVGSDESEDASYLEIGATVEASSRLAPPRQSRILSEFLAAEETRYPTVWLLQNRSDLVHDETLIDLTTWDSESVRLGAAYALLSRGHTDVLSTLLSDKAPSVRAYAARSIANYTEGYRETDWRLNPDEEDDPFVLSYLIRAYRPVRHRPDHVASIIALLRHPHQAVAAAAADRIAALGTRNYRVISALIDSARGDNVAAIDALGTIGDYRSIAPLLEIYERAPFGPVRRAAFEALDHLDVPYQNRPMIEVPDLQKRPTMDGLPDSLANVIGDLAHDEDARPGPRSLIGRVGRYADSLYVAIQTDFSTPPHTTLGPAPTDADRRVEIVLTTPNGQDQETYRVNALGRSNRERPLPIGSLVADGHWSLETLLPIASFPVLRFNLSVVSQTDRLSWSVTYGAPEDADRFGDLRFQPGSP